MAERAIKLSGSLQDGIDGRHLVEALKKLAGEDNPVAVVYGSGFERNPEMIEAISQSFPVAGNSTKTVRLIKDPAGLAELCDESGIPHPDIRFDIPDYPQDWLSKLAGGAGGSHVKPVNDGIADQQRYFQRFITGRNLSALFLANREKAHIVGFSQQWSSPSKTSPFRYGGAVRLRRYDKKNARQIEDWLTALTYRTDLAGLCSADFIVGDAGLHLIEINPRPGATLDIFDTEDTPLLRQHLRAVAGFDFTTPSYKNSAASAIAYTAEAISAFPEVVWPALTADHQMAGTTLQAGDPVCTVFATALSASAAMKAVKSRVKMLAVNWREEFS
ncbi:ATP-grasp domain-containing protein [Phyllobacterium myrsinacearum]|uniref:Putative ATP-grasp superfamily ATP-dependent carboligase n=1 Tax=Phyllobacterium myrsinacearum TaxID=28101 RepID=A0A839EV75_9HYPH|nr:ATP-grasp domain-containing protein [Phyllobacterium myrsinacearum]MBA8881404.1 putative ATP-grasp superfamily ATP-dependent carboligase [Phyllobacterium myrsinacearum]